MKLKGAKYPKVMQVKIQESQKIEGKFLIEILSCITIDEEISFSFSKFSVSLEFSSRSFSHFLSTKISTIVKMKDPIVIYKPTNTAVSLPYFYQFLKELI